MSDAKLEADAREALSFLWGARVQRVDGPSPTLFAFTLYDQGEKQSLIFSLAPPKPDLGLLVQRPSGQPASPFVRRLRTAIENARLSEARWLGGDKPDVASAVYLSFVRGTEFARVVVDLNAARPNLYLLGVNDVISGAANERTRRTHFPGPKATFQAAQGTSIAVVTNRESALTRGSALVQQSARTVDQGLRTQARTQAKAQLKRLARKAAAIQDDVARADTAALLRREANLLLCHLARIPTGAADVQLEDLTCDPAPLLQIKLDPALSAQANAERRFTRARRMQRGESIARARLAQTEAEAASLARFFDSIEAFDAASLIGAAEALGIKLDSASLETRSASPHKARQTHVPYRLFQAGTGGRILVGKGAADNDALTLTVARPHDLWLHARGLQGAHVIIPRERGSELSPDLLLDAAHLAAHFSSARGEASAEIQHAERRHVRKPKGFAPGAVRVDRERVLLLRVEPERLKRLLASEKSP